ncbi:uncharacterized protein LOC134784662 [Penaeus indicus]|uniref:uncharacterized protein LOC134784662 n=1 Tax=Penaeus indicus TaxID=29960 RepID=UPI00300C289C
MLFADNIVLCTEDNEEAEQELERWRHVLEKRWMKVSRSKTEYKCVNERDGDGRVSMENIEIKKVQEFKYLGPTTDRDGDIHTEVSKRLQSGWEGWRKVSSILCDRNMSTKIKGKKGSHLAGRSDMPLKDRAKTRTQVCPGFVAQKQKSALLPSTFVYPVPLVLSHVENDIEVRAFYPWQ